MDVGYGALAGTSSGAVAGFVVAILQLQAKRLRNTRLAAHGEAGFKDCILLPLWLPAGAIGLVLGAIAGGIWRSWQVAAMAGAALPSAFLVVVVIVTLLQSRVKKPV